MSYFTVRDSLPSPPLCCVIILKNPYCFKLDLHYKEKKESEEGGAEGAKSKKGKVLGQKRKIKREG